MKSLLTILVLIFSFSLSAQTTINGTVTNQKEELIVGANVYLEGTYDGGTTTDDGTFSFTTSETGTQTLIVSYLSFETFTMAGDVSFFKDLKIKLKDDVNALDAVVLSAGTF
ncbi:MAG: TonB-dependent receptor, partial [Bacteroidetes bacterium]